MVASAAMGCEVIAHPLVRAKVGVLRERGTGMELFRRTLRELGSILGYEALRDVGEVEAKIKTPMMDCEAKRLAKEVVIMPILRAGLGMADAVAEVVPDAKIGHIGMYRDETTLEPKSYFLRVPSGSEGSTVLVIDPMLATGNSAVDALDQLKREGCKDLRLVCVIGAPEGVKRVNGAHPEVPIFLAALDDGLDERGYILPGLGDAGDRYFGTGGVGV